MSERESVHAVVDIAVKTEHLEKAGELVFSGNPGFDRMSIKGNVVSVAEHGIDMDEDEVETLTRAIEEIGKLASKPSRLFLSRGGDDDSGFIGPDKNANAMAEIAWRAGELEEEAESLAAFPPLRADREMSARMDDIVAWCRSVSEMSKGRLSDIGMAG